VISLVESVDSLPHNLHAERGVLGAIILDSAALRVVEQHVSVGDFFDPVHQRIFCAMRRLAAEGRPIDEITLYEILPDDVARIAALRDGMPRVSPVEHYAQMVKEKSTLRALAYSGVGITRAALDGDAEKASALARTVLETRPMRNGLRVVSAEELLRAELKPREMVLDPILPAQGLAELYSKRGVGKAYLALEIADAVSCGRPCLRWQVPKPRGVVYVDGELPANVLQQRLRSIIAGAQLPPGAERQAKMLRIITPDLQTAPMPDLSAPVAQQMIERELEAIDVLILDSISTLCRAGKENEAESWLPIQEWLLRLRQRGLSVVFLHHAGKAGAQRGTSRREDVLDTVVALRHPSNYSPRDGLRFEVHFEKLRSHIGDQAKSFEVALEAPDGGAAIWTMRDVEDALQARAAELFEDNLSVRDIAEELGVSKSRVHRWKKKWETHRLAAGRE
jgi:putative DNA primase/helicase